jgi:hypothetical protein
MLAAARQEGSAKPMASTTGDALVDTIHDRGVDVRPVLPEVVRWIELDDVRIGDARVKLRFERRDAGVHVASEVHSGRLQVELADLPAADVFD